MAELQDMEEEWELVFREQDDGRRVSRLPSGKVVLVDLSERDRVQDGDMWHVRVTHMDAYAIAHLVELITDRPDAAPRRLDDPEDLVEEELLDDVVRTRAPRGHPVTRRESEHRLARPDEVIGPGERVAVFVDGSAADQACRDAGYGFDHARLLQWARGAGSLHGGYYYGADRRMESESQQQRFLDLLTHNCFILHLKAPRRDGRNASVTTEIAVDALDAARAYEVAWIVGGDADLSRLVDILRSRGKRVYLLASQGAVDAALAGVCNKPVFLLEDHRDELERRQ